MSPHRVALVRAPSPRLADGITTHVVRVPVDVARARAQWSDYCRALEDAGWRTVSVADAPDCPDSVFVEDTAIVVDGRAVLTRPGAESRRAEVAGTGQALAALGIESVSITAPGTLDGGDVLATDDRVYVGRGGRTDADGVRQLRAHLAGRGVPVVAVPISRVLHLKSAVTALPDDGTIIGWSPGLDDPSFFPRYRAMPEEAGAHVVHLGAGRLLISAAAPRSAEVLADLGYEPVPVDIGEF